MECVLPAWMGTEDYTPRDREVFLSGMRYVMRRMVIEKMRRNGMVAVQAHFVVCEDWTWIAQGEFDGASEAFVDDVEAWADDVYERHAESRPEGSRCTLVNEFHPGFVRVAE